MIVNFKLDDYYDICDEYEEIFEQEDVIDVPDGDEDCLVVRTRRIVVPALHASFREAEWLAKDPGTEEKNNENVWETQGSVIIQYDENEKDPTKFISYATCGLMCFAAELSANLGIHSYDTAQLDCYIDTSEFISE